MSSFGWLWGISAVTLDVITQKWKLRSVPTLEDIVGDDVSGLNIFITGT